MTPRPPRASRALAVTTAAVALAAGLQAPASAAPSDDGLAVARAIADEGVVLLENEQQPLPLAHDAQVAVFGSTQVAPFLGGGGSGGTVGAPGVGLLEAMRDEGFQLDEDLASRYTTWWEEGVDGGTPGKDQDYRPVTDTGGAFGEYGINSVARAEMPLSRDVAAEAAASADTAVVIIGRNGSEVWDPRVDDLELYPAEREMVDTVATAFDDVVVLFNTGVAMEMGFLDEYPSITAAAIIWAPGQIGMRSVADVLSGDVNPSGKLPHTIAYDTGDHPSTANFGDYVKPESQPGLDEYYVQYEEGVYVGYRYFETFDVPVQFPFGHGLSYTSFSREVLDVDRTDEDLSVATRVTNTGDVAGKEVVQVYVSAPDGELEHPTAELRGFGKTDLLAPGQSQVVTTTVDTYGLASWSEERGAYLLDAGTYTVRVGESVREADAAGSFTLDAPVVIDEDPTTGTALQSRFADAAARLTVLSKDDPAGTTPTPPATGTRTDFRVTPLGRGINGQGSGNPEGFLNAPGAMPALTGGDRIALAPGQEPAEIQLADVYADPTLMDAFLAQLTDPELVALHLQGGFKTLGVERLGIPRTLAQDGPAQVKAPPGSGGSNGTAFPVASMLAATWSTELAHRYGAAAGAEATALGLDAWYAPGANLHRNPQGGRNFEYYSEDPLLSAGMMADVVVGAGEQGVTAVVKHFALNEQETNRLGVETYVSERALRELYLKPFEYGVKAGALGMMAAFPRIGETWVGASSPLMQGVVRDEWGFDGFVVSDIAIGAYMNTVSASAAGTDLMLSVRPTYDSRGLADFSRALTEDPEATRAALEANAENVLTFVMTTPSFSTVLGTTENQQRPLDRGALPYASTTVLGADIDGLVDLREAFAAYQAEGAVTDPLARQVERQLATAERLVAQGREDQAVARLEIVARALANPPGRSTLTDEAAGRLGTGTTRVIEELRTA
ncbi:glycoside hydrolase family 3 C-terminal domain-containing protein [uncultured Pseudokineococcus sp.]|uniref:glycoside hydrolase family 3 C-terminal domain-containing protein n=1 Tax=uncultured Pseudokineococcus sp. TaxID=1642928 RepID=UPI0026242750|nr:glycoside hydrolase family 3 C-terminal domain-containing protein [uncultured Pseudokineococcus sp.]